MKNYFKKILIFLFIPAFCLLSTTFNHSSIKKDVDNLSFLNLNNQNKQRNIAISNDNYDYLLSLRDESNNLYFDNSNWLEMEDIKTSYELNSNNSSGSTNEVRGHRNGTAGNGYASKKLNESGNIEYDLSFFNVNNQYNRFIDYKPYLSFTVKIQVWFALANGNSSGSYYSDANLLNKQLRISNYSSINAWAAAENAWVSENDASFSIEQPKFSDNKITTKYNAKGIVKCRGSASTTYTIQITHYNASIKIILPNLIKAYSYMLMNLLKNNNFLFSQEKCLLNNEKKLILLNNKILDLINNNFDKGKYKNIYCPNEFNTNVSLKKILINGKEYYLPCFNFTFRDFMNNPIYGSNNKIINYENQYHTISLPIITNLWLNYNEQNISLSDIWFNKFNSLNPFIIENKNLKGMTGDLFISLINKHELKQKLLNELLNLNKSGLLQKPINTNLSNDDFNKLTFLNNQLNTYDKSDHIIDFDMERSYNPSSDIANGKLALSIIMGQNFINAYFQNDINLYDPKIWDEKFHRKGYLIEHLNGFRTQYDVYKLNNINDVSFMQSSTKSNEFNPIKGLEDSVVTANALTLTDYDNANKKIEETNIDEFINNEHYFDGIWILNNLITFSNENFYEPRTVFDQNDEVIANPLRYKITNNILEENDTRNSILATNLSKEDFINNVLLSPQQKQVNIKNAINENIKFVYRNQVLGKGLIQINLKGNLGDPFLTNKPKSLISPLNDMQDNQFIQHHANDEQTLYFWVDGFKKNYDFNVKTKRTLDATKLYIDSFDFNHQAVEYLNSLAKYTASDIKSMVDTSDPNNILLKGLINFNDTYDYNYVEQQIVNNKLLRTKLSFAEFLCLIKYKLLENNNESSINVNQINDFSGSYNGLIWFDPEAILHNHLIAGNGFEKLYFQNQAEFKIENLKRNVFLFVKKQINDQGYIRYSEVKDITVNEFLAGSDNNHLSQQFKQSFANMFLYKNNNIWTSEPTNEEFGQKIMLTNAANQQQIIDAIDDKTIVFEDNWFEANNPMGRLIIKFKVNLTNGSINNWNNESNQPINQSKEFILKIDGFKQQINIENTTIENDINVINKQLNLNINDVNQIDASFILDHLINYANTTSVDQINYIVNTNVTKDEFKNELLESLTFNPHKDDSEINGTIKFKEFKYNERLIDNNISTTGRVVEFKISGFKHKIKIAWNNNQIINLNNYFDQSIINFNDINKYFIIDHLIKFDDEYLTIDQKQPYLIATNVTKQYFINYLLNDIQINKIYSQDKLSIKITLNDNINDGYYINNSIFNNQFEIIGFNIKETFNLNNNIIYDNTINNQEVNIKTINEKMILDLMCSFQNDTKSYTTIINTNITKQDFIDNYLEKIIITNKDFANSKLSAKFYFKKVINGLLEFDFEIELLNKLNTITNINHQFNLNLNQTLASDFNQSLENIIKYISFNNQKSLNAIFTTNCTKQTFLSLLDENNPISSKVDNDLGLVYITLNFKQNTMNVEIDDNLVSLNSFSFTIGGFKNQINFKINTLDIDINQYDIFNGIDFRKIDQNFIINNLIKFSDDKDWTKNIIGNINITKEQFLTILHNIEIKNVDDHLKLKFNFKTNLNLEHLKKATNQVNNFECSLFQSPIESLVDTNNNLVAVIVGISVPLTIIIIGLTIFLIVYYYRNIKKFKNTVDNNI